MFNLILQWREILNSRATNNSSLHGERLCKDTMATSTHQVLLIMLNRYSRQTVKRSLPNTTVTTM